MVRIYLSNLGHVSHAAKCRRKAIWSFQTKLPSSRATSNSTACLQARLEIMAHSLSRVEVKSVKFRAFTQPATWHGATGCINLSRSGPLEQRFVQLWAGENSYKDNLGKQSQLPAALLLDKTGKVVERYTGRIPAEAWDKIADLL